LRSNLLIYPLHKKKPRKIKRAKDCNKKEEKCEPKMVISQCYHN
jgi:hypothetical protein